MHHLSRYRLILTQVLIGLLALGVWVLAIQHYFPAISGQAYAATSAGATKTLNTLNVHRINVKDANGETRFVISNENQFPAGKARGKTSKRSIHGAAGMVFYNSKGNEVGGLAVANLRDLNETAFILDYVYQPTDGIGIWRRESSDGKHWAAGFEINDRRPYHPGKIKSSQGVGRISLSDNDYDAEMVISDRKGRPRIRIGVGKDGKPHIQMLDADGKVVYNAVPTVRPANK